MRMNHDHTLDTSPDQGGDWLDGALSADARAHRESYIADDGFTARVMARLPSPMVLPAWRKPAVMALWAIAAAMLAVALPEAMLDVGREAYRLLAARPVSVSGIVAGAVAIGALTWAAAAYTLRAAD